MIRKSILLAAALAGGPAGGAGAQSADALPQAVARLGELNGVALACQQKALTARLRDIVIEVTPKERGIGEQFEQATSASFLEFGRSGATCPDGRSLAERIAAAEAGLREAAGAKP